MPAAPATRPSNSRLSEIAAPGGGSSAHAADGTSSVSAATAVANAPLLLMCPPRVGVDGMASESIAGGDSMSTAWATRRSGQDERVLRAPAQLDLVAVPTLSSPPVT